MTAQDPSTLSAAKQALLAKRLRGKSVTSTESEQGAIAKRSTTDPVPLSFAQQRLWFLDQLEGGQTATYNMPFVWSLQGALNQEALQSSIQEIIRRHESLRTTFALALGQPRQVIAPQLDSEMSVLDLSDEETVERQERTERLIREEINRPFDLQQGPLLRTLLIRTGAQEHVFVLTMHHIVSDGWSMGVLIKELIELYNAYSSGKPSPLPELPVQYPDFALWQRQSLQGDVLEKQVNYWKQHLGGPLPILELPTDRTPSGLRSAHGAQQVFKLSPALTAGLKELSQREGATLFMTLLAVFKTLLHRYSGQDDLLIGTPIAGRTRREIEGIIGFFVNTLVLRTDVSGQPTFRELLSRVRQVSLDAYANQDVPFEKLVEELQPERDQSQSPLFRAMFALMNAPMGDLELAGVRVQTLEAESDTAKFDLSMLVIEEADGLACGIEYRTDLFEAATIERMAGHFEQLLRSVVEDADRPINDLELLSEAERHLLLREWNQTDLDYPHDLVAHQLFEHWAEIDPSRTALIDAGCTLTYGELNARANQVAHHLQKKGVGPDSLVGLCMRRSADLLIGMLGILKAGGAYVPLDPNFPAERIGFTMEDAQIIVLLTQADLNLEIPPHDAQVVYIDADWEEIAQEPTVNPACTAEANHLAYVTYTSGSTGRPKGVAVEHRNAVALAYWARQVYQPEEWACALFASSICFDASVYDLFLTWDRGGTLIMVENVLYLPELPEREQVTMISSVPSALAELVRMNAIPPSVHTVNLGGEPLPNALAQKLYEIGVNKVFNVYGPSETTCISTFHLVEKGTDQPMTIGRPLSNEQLYVLDPSMHPVPIGVPGELYIAGDGVARGYLNRPELTAERFLPDPFTAKQGARMYKTGDLVRYLPDGRIEFLTRIDTQVKIRGQRVELGEIEARLAVHSEVREVVVDARPDQTGVKQLVAYLVVEPERTVTAESLRQWVRDQLPEYMVPAVFMILEELPKTATGKVERKALPTPEGHHVLESTYAPPRNQLTLRMVRTWEEVLNKRPIGVTDHFFAVGGDSLKAVSLMSAIENQFGVRLPLETIFKAATVSDMCQHVLDVEAGVVRNEGPILLQQGKGDQPPFFLIHPSGGGVLCYATLASSLGAEQTVYGLQAVGYESDEEALTDIHEMADRYLLDIKRVASAGPYRVGGWSFGGVVAYEIARRLEQQGEQVDVVALIDTPALDGDIESVEAEVGNKRLLEAYALEVVGLTECHLNAMTEEAAFQHVLQKAVEHGVLPPAADVEMIRREIKMLAAHTHAMLTYACAEPIQADLHLLAVQELARGQVLAQPERWQARTTGRLTVYAIPGDHFSLIQPPHVFAVANAMKEAMGLVVQPQTQA